MSNQQFNCIICVQPIQDIAVDLGYGRIAHPVCVLPHTMILDQCMLTVCRGLQRAASDYLGKPVGLADVLDFAKIKQLTPDTEPAEVLVDFIGHLERVAQVFTAEPLAVAVAWNGGAW